MGNRVWDLFRRAKRTPRLDSQTVTRDRMDDHVYDETKSRAELLRKATEQRPLVGEGDEASEYAHWDDLIHDMFVSYHTQDAPQLLPSDAVKPSREVNRRAMRQLISTDEHGRTRAMTKHDAIASAFAAMSVREKMVEYLEGAGKELAEQAQQAAKQEQKIEQSQQALDELREQIAAQQEPASAEQKEQMRNAAEQKSNASHKLAGIAEAIANQPQTVEQASVINAAAKEGREAAQVMASLPGMGRGTHERMSPDDALRLAQMFRDNPILQAVAELLGRMLRDMRFKRARRITGGSEEIVDVELGDELSRLLPQELMTLRHPILKRDFKRRYYEKSLLQYQMQGEEHVGLGPLIIVKDSSGSMKGQKHVWAVALSLALVAIANREKRDAFVIDYDSYVNATYSFMYRQPLDPNAVVEMASLSASGGTDTNTALSKADDTMKTSPAFHRADIVIVSDGNDSFTTKSESLHSGFEEQGVRVHGIQVGSAVRSYLEKMCSHVAPAYDLSGANDASDLLATAVN